MAAARLSKHDSVFAVLVNLPALLRNISHLESVSDCMKRRLVRIVLILLLFPVLLSIAAGWLGAPGFLHPEKRSFTPDMVRDADVTFGQIGARREDFEVRTSDGAMLRGWKVRAAKPNGAWVLVLHGVADNRYGMTEHARLLLQSGYDVVMMDSRAHGV